MHIESISRLLAIIFGTYTFLGLCLFKTTLYLTLARPKVNNYNTKNILIIGSRQRAIEFIKIVLRRKASGYRILGCLETNDQQHLVGTNIYESVKIIGTINNFNDLLQHKTIDEVVFGIPLDTIKNVHDIIYYAEEMGKNVYILPDFQISKIKYYPQTAKANIEDFLGASTLVLSSLPKNTNELLLKSFVDFFGSIFGMILFPTIFIPICLAIKATSPGPILFSQERIGLNGRRFQLHKFRTMVVNAEDLKDDLMSENEMDGPVFKIKNDPRITSIGRFLRKTSLDELPQLSNVFKGEMSLVGPRPPLPSEGEKYKLWQRRRLSMKPGLTCIWQVSGRNNIPFEKWMSMDLEYIDNWSLSLDLKLIILTVKEVTVGGGH
jgi:exopolysaccharide biosynthesis polyprenyl glycosylphosphotransferase